MAAAAFLSVNWELRPQSGILLELGNVCFAFGQLPPFHWESKVPRLSDPVGAPFFELFNWHQKMGHYWASVWKQLRPRSGCILEFKQLQ